MFSASINRAGQSAIAGGTDDTLDDLMDILKLAIDRMGDKL